MLFIPPPRRQCEMEYQVLACSGVIESTFVSFTFVLGELLEAFVLGTLMYFLDTCDL